MAYAMYGIVNAALRHPKPRAQYPETPYCRGTPSLQNPKSLNPKVRTLNPKPFFESFHSDSDNFGR